MKKNQIRIWSVGGTRMPHGRFFDAVERLFKMLKLKGKSVDIFLLHGKDMVHLKKRSFSNAFRGKKMRKKVRVVDVLAFPAAPGFPHPEDTHIPLGEMYLNYDILKADFNRGVFLAIHGVLHLLGYLHERAHDAARMEKKEHALWRRIVSLD